jgi:hypothetical protein
MSDASSIERRLSWLMDKEEIREVIYRYARGIDRLQYDLVRSCYHPDGTDDHGDFRGGIDGFIEYITAGLGTWERTMHFMGNCLIEPNGDMARAETYALTYHRVSARGDKPALDFLGAVRYLDDFEKRNGEWKILSRVCVVDWTRTDVVAARGWRRPDDYTQPHRSIEDPVFADVLRDIHLRQQ